MKKVQIKHSLFACMIIFAVLYGCGVKGNPVLLKGVSDSAPMIQNLKASADNDAVLLRWDFKGGELKKHYILVEKSEAGGAGNECTNCPGTFERICRIGSKELEEQNEGYNRYIDKYVTKGKTYQYRLLICDSFNHCSVNAVTEINFE